MVARHNEQSGQARLLRVARGVFAWWRNALTRSLRRAAVAVRRMPIRNAAGAAVRTWFRPAAVADLRAGDLPTAMTLPAILLAAAAAASGALGLRQGAALWAYAAGLGVWSAARLAVLLALAPSAGAPRERAAMAWAAALPPFVLSAIPGFGLVAFALSAFVAYRALVAIGATERSAAQLVAWAYGGHALAAGAAAVASALFAA